MRKIFLKYCNCIVVACHGLLAVTCNLIYAIFAKASSLMFCLSCFDLVCLLLFRCRFAHLDVLLQFLRHEAIKFYFFRVSLFHFGPHFRTDDGNFRTRDVFGTFCDCNRIAEITRQLEKGF
jgi:hypothetical protein